MSHRRDQQACECAAQSADHAASIEVCHGYLRRPSRLGRHSFWPTIPAKTGPGMPVSGEFRGRRLAPGGNDHGFSALDSSDCPM
jgi:hypothetical protein